MKELENIKELFVQELGKVKTSEDLNNLRVMFLGKSGHLTTCMKLIKDLSVEEKKAFGSEVNVLKTYVNDTLEDKKTELDNLAIQRELDSIEMVDLTVPSSENKGSLHPVTIIQQRLVNIFRGMGFTVEDGNEIEIEYDENAYAVYEYTEEDGARLLEKGETAIVGEVYKAAYPSMAIRQEQVKSRKTAASFYENLQNGKCGYKLPELNSRLGEALLLYVELGKDLVNAFAVSSLVCRGKR